MKLKIGQQFNEFILGLNAYPKAIQFMRENKRWIGFWKYGWVSRILDAHSLIIGLKFFMLFTASFFNLEETEGPILFGIGAVLNIILLIPLVGPIIGPVLAAIASTLIMYRLADFHVNPITS